MKRHRTEPCLAYADFRGNTQLVSVGNMSRRMIACSLILMDYPNRRRLKILGRMSVDVAASVRAADLANVKLPEYKARIERVVFIDVAEFDSNYPQLHYAATYAVGTGEPRTRVIRLRIVYNQIERQLILGETALIAATAFNANPAIWAAGVRTCCH